MLRCGCIRFNEQGALEPLRPMARNAHDAMP